MESGKKTAHATADTPLLSLVVPVWNQEGGGVFATCVLEAIADAGGELQVIIVDDRSEESHFAALDRAFGGLSNVVIVRTQKNTGPGGARNLGLDLVRSEWVAFADSDDDMRINGYLDLARLGERNVHDVVAGAYRIQPSRKTGAKPRSIVDRPQTSLAETIARRAAVWRFAFKTDFLRRRSIRFPEIRYAEDLLFMLQVALQHPNYSGYSDVEVTTYLAPRLPDGLDRSTYQDVLTQLARMYEISEDRTLRRIIAIWRVRIIAYTSLLNHRLGSDLMRDLGQLLPRSRSEAYDLAIAGSRLMIDLATSRPLSLSTRVSRFKKPSMSGTPL